jgi:trehalose-phosphatase
MSQPLFKNLTEINRRLRAAPHILLFSDFDGTLAPIVDYPDRARLPPETKELLIGLSRHSKISTAIISGRALADIRARVGIDHLIYAGNHGLEISGPNFHFVHPKAAARQEALRQLSDHLAARLRHVAGVAVEPKGLTASIHFRRVAPAEVNQVVEIVKEVALNQRRLFRLTTGKMVCEICPRVNWHKGAAARWIRDRLGYPDPLAIYLGDDDTDENAFADLRQDLTVKVGPAMLTLAHYHLADSREVRKFLRWLEGSMSAQT